MRPEGEIGVDVALQILGIQRRREGGLEEGQVGERLPFGGAHRRQLRERERLLGVVLHEGLAVGQIDVLQRLLEMLLRPLDEHPAHLARRLVDGVARHVELPRGRGGPRQRRERRVGTVDGHVLQLDAQHLGGDLAEAVHLPRAQIGHAAADDGGAVQFHPHPGAGGVVKPGDAPVGLHVGGETPSDADDVPVAAGQRRGIRRLAQRLQRPRGRLLQPDGAGELLSRGDALARAQVVHPPHV